MSLYGNNFEYKNNPTIRIFIKIGIDLHHITTVISLGGGGNVILSPVPWLLFPCSIVSETHLKNCLSVELSAESK